MYIYVYAKNICILEGGSLYKHYLAITISMKSAQFERVLIVPTPDGFCNLRRLGRLMSEMAGWPIFHPIKVYSRCQRRWFVDHSATQEGWGWGLIWVTWETQEVVLTLEYLCQWEGRAFRVHIHTHPRKEGGTSACLQRFLVPRWWRVAPLPHRGVRNGGLSCGTRHTGPPHCPHHRSGRPCQASRQESPQLRERAVSVTAMNHPYTARRWFTFLKNHHKFG